MSSPHRRYPLHHPSSPVALLRLLLVLLLSASCVRGAGKLLVIYMDAMRWDYVQRRLEYPYRYPEHPDAKSTPVKALLEEPANGLLLMRRLGAYVRRVKPVFPTQCLPNIHTAFTGRLPRYHGMLGSQMYDARSGFLFNYHAVAKRSSDVETMVAQFEAAPAGWWEPRPEPLWDTLGKQRGRPADIYNLPSIYELREMERRQRRRLHNKTSTAKGWKEEVEGKGLGLNHTILPYQRGATWSAFRGRVMDAMRRLMRNVTDLAVVYSDALDGVGHTYGPTSMHVRQTMRRLDSLFHWVLHELTLRENRDLHVMLLSDHGMQAISESKVVRLEWFVLRSRIKKIINDGSIAGIWPRKRYMKQVYERLVAGQKSMRSEVGFDIYWKDDPEIARYFWAGPSDPRIPPLVVVARRGFVLLTKDFPFPQSGQRALPQGGLHGYHPSHDDMHTAMLLYGPKVAPGAQLDALNATDVYQLMCRILDVAPRPHNGSAPAVVPLLRASRMVAQYTALRAQAPVSGPLRASSSSGSGAQIGPSLLLLLGMAVLGHTMTAVGLR